MKINPLTAIDFYKADHISQYPEGTESVYSNFTPRSLKRLPKLSSENGEERVVFFGMQYFIKWFLMDTFSNHFFNLPKYKAIKQYKRRMDTSLGPEAISMEHIEALHDLGYIPLVIKALPEGVAVAEKIPFFTIKETHPDFSWLVNYLETILSCLIWGPSTSATIARKYKKLLKRYAKETGGDINFVQFQGHDFSFRGMSSYQSAIMSGAGHLLSFVGTDTVAAIDFLEDYYNADAEKELVGCSVPATEHSVMCLSSFVSGVSTNETEAEKIKRGEFNQFKRLITEIYPKGIVSIVSDSFDFWQVVTDFLPRLKPEIMARSGGYPVDKVVIRPDSGDPVKIICGTCFYPDKNDPRVFEAQYQVDQAVAKDCDYIYFGNRYFEIPEEAKLLDYPFHYIKEVKSLPSEAKGAIECLWDTFGGTITSEGYKVLDSHIGLIYGDSITLQRAEEICQRLKNKGFASTNVVLGIGSFTYQYNTRDTAGFAMKATAGVVNGEFKEIYKNPKTDNGLKKSARGLLRVDLVNGEYVLKDRCTPEEEKGGELKEVFRDGKLLVDWKLSEIRKRIEESL